MRDNDSGVLSGGSEPRADGIVAAGKTITQVQPKVHIIGIIYHLGFLKPSFNNKDTLGLSSAYKTDLVLQVSSLSHLG